MFSCLYIRPLSKAGLCFSVSVSYSVFHAEVKNYVAMPNMLTASIYLKMRASSFKGFQNMYFHGMCILGTFSNLYPGPVKCNSCFSCFRKATAAVLLKEH